MVGAVKAADAQETNAIYMLYPSTLKPTMSFKVLVTSIVSVVPPKAALLVYTVNIRPDTVYLLASNAGLKERVSV